MAKSKIALKDRRPLFDQIASMQNHYLGWDKPLLQAACDFLFQRYRTEEAWDLSGCIVVLPGGLAGRRLATLMAQRAATESIVTRPPEIITVGKLPELLYSARLPFASDLEQTLAWTKVLRSGNTEFLRPLLIEIPDRAEVRPWIDLAKLMSSLHRELSSDLVDFEDVKDFLNDPREIVRWEILAQLQMRYLAELHEAGLWDLQTARRYAIDQNEVKTDKDIILIGTPDLNQAQRRFLEKVKERVHVLIGAPVSYEAGFHSDGTLAVEFWQDLAIDIPEERIHVRPTPAESAKELVNQLAQLDSDFSVSEITIGIPDASVVPVLQETLGDFGVSLRYGPGAALTQSPPMKLLEQVIEYVATGSIEAFNQLVRVPSVEAWLVEQPEILEHLTKGSRIQSLLAALDKYQEATLIRTVIQMEWPEMPGKELFVSVVDCLDKWVNPLRCTQRPLEKWADPIRNVLRTAYETMKVSPENSIGNMYLRSSQQINAMLDELANLPSNLDAEVGLHEAFTWLYGQLETKQIPALHENNEIEMLGWLELVLDDAPVLMLTGMQDGIVPESVNGDAFLPNQLRSLLGLMDNSRRYARDCYAMLTLLHTRVKLEIILNHLGVDGDPKTPSRLLMAVPPDALARRVRWLLEPKTDPIYLEPSKTWSPRKGQTNIPIPIPVLDRPITDMAVTDFKKYDQCPYRFYLQKIEKARAFEHEKLELDGGGFGDLVHKCLESFENSPVAKSTDPDEVKSFLVEQLHKIAKLQFGVQRPPALVIQLEQAERRLEEFAKHQANWASQGWEIKYIEYTVEKSDGMTIPIGDGRSMHIHGRIDRIDYNPKLDRYAVLDYKTGDSTVEPRSNHMKKDLTWIDWQLPLYGVLVRAIGLTDLSRIDFGYILLPKNPADTKFVIADFSELEHQAALESASAIAANVLDGQFWPPKYKNIHPLDDYNAITQLSVARRWDRKIAEEEAAQSVELLNQSDSAIAENSSVENSDATSSETQEVSSESTLYNRLTNNLIPSKIRLDPVKAKGEPAADWFTPTMILASAGTGKTFNLAARALRLLFADQSLDSILATTFTRKAAGEILHRVLSWLAKAIEEPNELVKLQQILSPLEVDVDTVKYQLGRLCSHLHRFRVSTLDSFYSQLARSFALELNLPPGWSLSDPYQTEQLQHEAISRMFETMTHTQLRSLVSQLSKGEATRSIRKEIESVVTTGYDLYRRTNEEHWNNLTVPKAPDDSTVLKALNFFTNSEVKDSRYKAARDKAVALFENSEWSEFLSHTLVKKIHDSEPKYYKANIDSSVIASIEVLAKRAVTGELTIRRSQNEAAYSLLSNYHLQMQAVKSRHRTVTFDDISERLSKWMSSIIVENKASATPSDVNSANAVADPQSNARTSMEGIAYRLDCPIDHLLLDEFQDTSPVQWEIVKPFAEAIIVNTHRRSSFFCVGDTKQAIYSWRGGVSEIFESVADQLQTVKKEQLVKSYRSSPVVINFVNEVFTQLDKHDKYGSDDGDSNSDPSTAVLRWVSRNYQAHETAQLDLPGYVEIRNANIDKSQKDEDANDESDPFLEEVVERIAELHRSAPHVEIGVLARTNQDIGSIINMLRERGIEASQEGGNPLTDSAPILLLLSAMKVANHPADSLAFFHVNNSPLKNLFSGDSLSSSQKLSAEIRSWIDAFGFGQTISQLARAVAPECNDRDQDRLRQLIQLAYKFEGIQVSSLYDFISFVEQQKIATPGASKIRVMTIHQSKGLEFDAVFLPSLEKSLVSRVPSFVPMFGDRTKPPIGVSRYIAKPLHRYLEPSWTLAFNEYDQQQMAEALCLFYVALTRAKNALYLYTRPSKNSARRWGSVLQSIFATQEQKEAPGILIHAWGDRNWYSGLATQTDSEPSTVEVAQDSTTSPNRIRLLGTSNQARILPSLRPSHREIDTTINLGSQWEAHDPSGAIIGKIIHRWFEEIRGWIDDYRLDLDKLKQIAASVLTLEEMTQIRVDTWLSKFENYISQPGVKKLLSESRYADWKTHGVDRIEVTNERKLLQVMEESLLRGVIDRCVIGYQGANAIRAEIIDFKTDQRPKNQFIDDWVQFRKNYHLPQLALYRRAIAQQYSLPLESISMALVLLSEDKIVRL